MICPKCRKIYPDGQTVCPDCQLELIGLLGDADAPDDTAANNYALGNETDTSSAIVYRTADEPIKKRNSLPVLLLALSLIFFAASGLCYFLS